VSFTGLSAFSFAESCFLKGTFTLEKVVIPLPVFPCLFLLWSPDCKYLLVKLQDARRPREAPHGLREGGYVYFMVAMGRVLWETHPLVRSNPRCGGNLGFPSPVAGRGSPPREGAQCGCGSAEQAGMSYVRCCLCGNPVTATASVSRGKQTGSNQFYPTAHRCVRVFVLMRVMVNRGLSPGVLRSGCCSHQGTCRPADGKMSRRKFL